MTTLTPEQAAKKIIGKYNPWEAFTDDEMSELGTGYHWGVYDYLRDINITPCKICGAYRKVDKCVICEKFEELE